MRGHRIIVVLLPLLSLGGCDYEKQLLEKDKQDLKAEVRQLQNNVQELTAELDSHKNGDAEKWRTEYFFRRDLDQATACSLVSELPIMCSPGLAEARSRVLAEATKKGIASTHGNQYWFTLILSSSGFLLLILLGWLGKLLLVDPTGKGMRAREETRGSAQADLDKITQAGKMAEVELSKVNDQVRTQIKELTELQRRRDLALGEAEEAEEEAERAQAKFDDLQQRLDLLKGFKK